MPGNSQQPEERSAAPSHSPPLPGPVSSGARHATCRWYGPCRNAVQAGPRVGGGHICFRGPEPGGGHAGMFTHP